MRIQWTSSAIAWVARVVAHTLARATIAPTDRSMPPPPMTKVMPTLTTPMTDAKRRIVMTLSTLPKRSPAVRGAGDAEDEQRDDEAEVASGRAGEQAAAAGSACGASAVPAVCCRSGVGDAGPAGSGDLRAVGSRLMPRLLS